MNRAEKEAKVEEIAAQIEGADAIFAVDYRGISVPQAAELRGRLHEAGASFKVVKNRLTKLAARKAGEERLDGLLEGPTALAFVNGDTALAAKAIAGFRKEHEVVAFKGGFMDGLELDPESFASIARLPSREVLEGRLAGVVASPLTGVVRGLGSMVQGLAIQLRQIADKGLVSGAPETEQGEADPSAPGREAEEADGDESPSEEASQSDSSPTSEGDPETDQGETDPPAADAERSTPAESDDDKEKEE